ncbi:PREDICTED: arf-GAP domain and FG repeat-containing protein 1-like isoform X2 [Priapulus caudatus]|uniref:Arf-GAP domain and FG repeat-containing protein 1-like isoform X2 n=1 Tax=Priapulus caudatus TaxID=37621 RepID=A0ABM1E198_PRICU|nr:PREDICTED: arf-GAP domain and FG repeat-containing protein 1-like isoform X2 [Priapulus caudatus]
MANFADFGNFNTFNSTVSAQQNAPVPVQTSQSFDMFAPPSGGSSAAPQQQQQAAQPAMGDKYAALAELDDVFGGSSTASGDSWSGTSPPAPATGATAHGWQPNNAPAATNAWNSGAGGANATWNNTAVPGNTATQWNSTAALPATSNPFSMTSTGTSQTNPFTGFGSPPGAAAGGFHAAAPQSAGGAPQHSGTGFAQFAPAGQPATGFAQSAQGGFSSGANQGFAGMQNGVAFGSQAYAPQQWGASVTSSWGAAPQAPSQSFTQPGMPAGGGQFNAFQGGFGNVAPQQSQQFAGWGQQPTVTANPFMAAPGANKSNPFL